MRIENSFIPVRGVGTATERRLWESGVTEWDEFGGASVRGVGATTAGRIESFIDEAAERLDDGDARFFDAAFPSGERWRLYENFRESACFFDIETTGLSQDRDRVTTVTFHGAGGTTTLVRGRDLTREAVRDRLDDADLLVSFNGKRFDAPFLEASFDLDVDTPHLDLMYPCRALELTGGLKPVERELGVAREGPDVTGRDAVRLWYEYEDGDESALETLVSYNRDDTVNLRTIADEVTSRLHRETFPSVDG
ncbi:ribonuclease H-like domain-containing protein [Halorarum salinum]|uniref:Ribonuclease H-like domain-containing protein n=1 Tax=Halorarum salinum TaxID=2743089 RepID=A0A7D5QHQ0_9EURY|nr:ribonuclease H-like domain-containing protein [Halobaculum salinum]QLG62384.1 ribonuclease H-like domain-containing protein [Halobaculum salinum]